MDAARLTCSRGGPWVNRLDTLRLSVSAVRWWPMRSCSSREILTRSAMRVFSVSSAWVATSWELTRLSSARALTWLSASSEATKGKDVSPRFMSRYTRNSSQLPSGLKMTQTLNANDRQATHTAPTSTGSTHGSRAAATMANRLPRPVWVKWVTPSAATDSTAMTTTRFQNADALCRAMTGCHSTSR